MFALALVAATATAEETRELPMPAWAFGVIAIVVFAALLAVTYSFKSAGTKHAPQDRGSSH